MRSGPPERARRPGRAERLGSRVRRADQRASATARTPAILGKRHRTPLGATSKRRGFTGAQATPSGSLWRRRPRCWKFFEHPPDRMLILLTPPDRARTAYYVGGFLPDLKEGKKCVMTNGQTQKFEDFSKSLSNHDEMLYRALGLKENFFFPTSSSRWSPGDGGRKGGQRGGLDSKDLWASNLDCRWAATKA